MQFSFYLHLREAAKVRIWVYLGQPVAPEFRQYRNMAILRTVGERKEPTGISSNTTVGLFHILSVTKRGTPNSQYHNPALIENKKLRSAIYLVRKICSLLAIGAKRAWKSIGIVRKECGL